ncbi:MAG: alkaline phosphatase [Methylacidiphilales bacterium]|nr:alkaline phosphatase [Candidatus Methylacidiphilales bacterium]
MKWRIVLTVLFVLALFAGFAYLYVNAFVRKHQDAVILFVVNGLDLNTLNLARQQLGRSPLLSDPDDPNIGDARRRAAYRSSILNIDSFWNIALLGVQDSDRPVPDEGADATALACGVRVQNGYIGGNQPIRSLIYAAEQAQRATGLVTTSSLVQPTPVAFYSSTMGTPEPYSNAAYLLRYSNINIILGGGEQYFIPANAANEWGRRDNINLLDEAKGRGYKVVRSRDELNGVFTWNTGRLFGVFAPDQFYFYSLQPERSRQPSLAEMTRTAISCLNHNYGSYFLVVEHDLVARASERNLGKLAVNEVAEVDEAIESAVEYAGPDALVMVTNNYSLGSVGPLPVPTPDDVVAAPSPDVKTAPPPTPLPLWLAGPGGPPTTRAQAAWMREHYDNGLFSTNAHGLLQPQPAFRFQTQAAATAEPAWLASRGEGSLQLRGFLSNTDVLDIVSEQF